MVSLTIYTVDSNPTDGRVAANFTRKLGIVHLFLHVTNFQYAALVSSKYLVQARSILYSRCKEHNA